MNTEQNIPSLTLGYWHARGRAEVARQLLAYCNVKFINKTYTSGEEWFAKDKSGLGLSIPNLPYLLHDSYNLTESLAIYRYIPKKFGQSDLLGNTLEDEGLVMSLMMINYDIDHLLVSLFWDAEWKDKLQGNLKKAEPLIQKVSKIYGEKPYALQYLTVCDFLFGQISYYIQKIAPEVYKKYGFLQKVRENINNIPSIKKYYQESGSLPFVQEGDLKF